MLHSTGLLLGPNAYLGLIAVMAFQEIKSTDINLTNAIAAAATRTDFLHTLNPIETATAPPEVGGINCRGVGGKGGACSFNNGNERDGKEDKERRGGDPNRRTGLGGIELERRPRDVEDDPWVVLERAGIRNFGPA